MMGTEEGAKELRATAEEKIGPCPICKKKTHEYQRRLLGGYLMWPFDWLHECKDFQALNPQQRAKVIQEQGGCVVCLSIAHTNVRCNMVWRHTEGGPSIGCQEKKGSGACGQQHLRLLHGSKSAYASANVVAGALRGQASYRPDWFSGRPMGSLLTEGTAVAVFMIMEAPIVSVVGRKTQSFVFVDAGSNMNFITLPKVKLYRIAVEEAKKQIHWMEAVGVGSITESVPLQNKDEITRNFPEIREGAVMRPAGAAGLLISMTE